MYICIFKVVWTPVNMRVWARKESRVKDDRTSCYLRPSFLGTPLVPLKVWCHIVYGRSQNTKTTNQRRRLFNSAKAVCPMRRDVRRTSHDRAPTVRCSDKRLWTAASDSQGAWKTYKHESESSDEPVVRLKKRRRQIENKQKTTIEDKVENKFAGVVGSDWSGVVVSFPSSTAPET